jgi:hypothetical protein
MDITGLNIGMHVSLHQFMEKQLLNCVFKNVLPACCLRRHSIYLRVTHITFSSYGIQKLENGVNIQS